MVQKTYQLTVFYPFVSLHEFKEQDKVATSVVGCDPISAGASHEVRDIQYCFTKRNEVLRAADRCHRAGYETQIKVS